MTPGDATFATDVLRTDDTVLVDFRAEWRAPCKPPPIAVFSGGQIVGSQRTAAIIQALAPDL
jgi:hypothetical protein